MPSIRWLEAAAEGSIQAVTSAEVLQEILHVLIRRERRQEALELARNTIELCTDVLPVTRAAIEQALRLLGVHPNLSPRDALHAATAQTHGLAEILSADGDFGSIEGIIWVGLEPG